MNIHKNSVLCLAVTLLGVGLAGCSKSTGDASPSRMASNPSVRLGFSPYPDSGLPIVTKQQDLFKKNGVDVELKSLQWGECMVALASGSIDVVIQNMNSFHETYTNLKSKGKELVFCSPLFVFQGGGIMVRGNSGILPLASMMKKFPNREEAIRQTILQFRGKSIITPHGTDHEQMVLAALKLAGLQVDRDVKIKHAEGDEGVAAFIGGEADACTGGLVQRLAVEQRGGYLLIAMDDIIPPVINGLITTREYADAHPDTMKKLSGAWFATVSYMETDPKGRCQPFLDYLASQGSAKFTPSQYLNVWKFGDVFPKSSEDAKRLFEDPSSKYFWKNSWNSIGNFLVSSKKISAAAPESAYMGFK